MKTKQTVAKLKKQMMEKELLKLFRSIYLDINIDAYVKPKSKKKRKKT